VYSGTLWDELSAVHRVYGFLKMGQSSRAVQYVEANVATAQECCCETSKDLEKMWKFLLRGTI